MAKETGKSAGTAEKQAEAVQEPNCSYIMSVLEFLMLWEILAHRSIF